MSDLGMIAKGFYLLILFNTTSSVSLSPLIEVLVFSIQEKLCVTLFRTDSWKVHRPAISKSTVISSPLDITTVPVLPIHWNVKQNHP